MSFDKAMMKAASELNESCPIMIDQDTRLDNAVVLPDNIFQFNYTLVNQTKSDIDIEQFTSRMTPKVTNSVKTNPNLEAYRDNSVTMSYYYKDQDGEFIVKISVTQEDYK